MRECPDHLPAGHAGRLHALDPLLPRTARMLPEFAAGDVVLRVPGADGVYRRHRPLPGAFETTWKADDEHQLHARVGGPDPAAALDALLAVWGTRISATLSGGRTGERTEAVFTWPSRDTALTAALLAHGLTPKIITAARPASRPAPRQRTRARREPVVRPLTADDVTAATRLWLEELRWEEQFGVARLREDSEYHIRRRLRGRAVQDASWIWVAEAGHGRGPAGLLAVEPPQQSGWAAAMVSSRRVGYLTSMVVAAEHRGRGVGSALVRTAHRALAEAGCTLTLLHYAALNPLSGPFWHRWGYRPLWTTWSRFLAPEPQF